MRSCPLHLLIDPSFKQIQFICTTGSTKKPVELTEMLVLHFVSDNVTAKIGMMLAYRIQNHFPSLSE